MTDLAIWMAGHVSVPLYTTHRANHSADLEHSESKMLLSASSMASSRWSRHPPGIAVHPATRCRRRTAIRPGTISSDHRALQGEPVRSGEELAKLMYTSARRQPEGREHSFNNFNRRNRDRAQSACNTASRDRMLSYCRCRTWPSACSSNWLARHPAAVVLRRTLDTFVQDLQRARATAIFSVPRLGSSSSRACTQRCRRPNCTSWLSIPILGGIVRKKVLKGLGLDQCTFAGGGAAPMPPDLLRWYARLGLPIIEGYGMTENCGVSHATLPGKGRPGTVGLPYEGVESRLDPQSGEIQVRGPGMMLGYYKEPELTRDSFTADGW